MKFSMIAAIAGNGVIGVGNDLPWNLPDEIGYFRKKTAGHTVIMGRKTFESIGSKPLPKRRNIVISRGGPSSVTAPGVEVFRSLEQAVSHIMKDGADDEPFIIGGGLIYEEAFRLDEGISGSGALKGFLERLYLTIVHTELHGDAYFPKFSAVAWKETSKIHHAIDEKHAYSFDYLIYEKTK